MKTKSTNILYVLLVYITLSSSLNAQKSVSILLNSVRTQAQIQNGQVISVNKDISSQLLNAIRSRVNMDSDYYRELNDILAGKYGTYYADLVKKELREIQAGKIKKANDELSRTAVVDIKDINVSFVPNTAKLIGSSSEDLVNLTKKLKTLNVNYIMIEGHKKSNTIDDYILTTNRVNACKDYLTFKGINRNLIKTKILLVNSDKKTSDEVRIIVK